MLNLRPAQRPSDPLLATFAAFALVLSGACSAPIARAESSPPPDAAARSAAGPAAEGESGAREIAAVRVDTVRAPAERIDPGTRTSDGAARLIALAQQENRVIEVVRTLAKEHPKRLTGSKGYEAAAQWALEQFRSYGLDARLETWGEFPIAFDRGVQSGRMIFEDGSTEPLEFATMAWTAGTQGPARGRAVLEPRSEEELAAVDTQTAFAGAWMVRAESQANVRLRNKVRDLCEEAGSLGTLRRGASSGLLTMGGNPRVDPAKLPTRVEAKVLASQHDALVARLERGEAVEIELHVENRFGDAPVACANVVADIVGTRFPDEFVIVQGHLDAWDGAEGAQDNATGVATALEAARLITASGLRPQRTIRFVLYSGEEQGLHGSQGYVRDHAAELENVSVVLNHDGGGTYLAGLDATYAMLEDMERVCAPLVALDRRFPFEVREVDGLVNSGDSDHAPFLEAGVPAFFWHQSEKNYTRVHHTQHDTFEEIVPEEVSHSAVVVAVAAFGFADLDHRLDRTDMKPIPRRRLGVRLDDDATLSQVSRDGRAGKAGWQRGDRIVGVDGEPVTSDREVLEKLNSGAGRKSFRLRRGEEELETVIDWGDAGGEAERAARAARRAAFLQGRSTK